MNLNGTFALAVAVFLIVPGYILLAVANVISPRYSGKQVESLVLSLAYGIIVLFIFLHVHSFNLSKAGVNPESISLNPDTVTFDAIMGVAGIECTLIFMSIIGGVTLGLIRRTAFAKFVLQRLGLSVEQSSWDYMFEQAAKKNKGCWTVIKCKDGDTVSGLFYSCSHASMASDGVREIYLEKAYDYNPNTKGDWKLDNATMGVYVKCEDILWLKMYYGEGDEPQEQRTEIHDES